MKRGIQNGIEVLNNRQTFQAVMDNLTENIPFIPFRSLDQMTVFDILLRAASGTDTLENTCRVLKNAPCSNMIRNSLEQYSNLPEAENHINRALQAKLPPGIRDSRLYLATDYNKLPYYGVPSPKEIPYVCKSKAESGTTKFYVYATVYVIRKNRRVTIALTAVRADDTLCDVLTRLFSFIASMNITVKCLYADRGYYSVPVIRWLKDRNIPFVMPAVIRGKNGGTRQVVSDKSTRITEYTMQSQKYGSIKFDMAVICVYSKGKYGRHGTEAFAYAFYMIDIPVRQIHKAYRKRFGIETSFRQKNLCRIRTTIKDPGIRVLFVALSFIILNVWVFLLREYVSYPGKGGRLIKRELFPLKMMLLFIQTVIDQKYKLCKAVYLL